MMRSKSAQKLVDRLQELTTQDLASPSPQTHFELLQTIDQLRLAIETPEETVLRLVYQVRRIMDSADLLLRLGDFC